MVVKSGNTGIMRFKITHILSLLLLFMCGCKEEGRRFPIEPSLEFVRYMKTLTPDNRDSVVVVTLRYTDGDGDIGLSDADTLPPFHFDGPNFYNLFVQYFVRRNGQLQARIDPLTLDTLHFNLRLPVITPSGPDKQVEGDIRLDIPARPGNFMPDTMVLRCRLTDRALHSSRVVQTPDIPLVH
jgi:hypothetical protein